MTFANTITVIIPAFNESGHLADTISEVIPAVSGEFADYEIIVFDDGSTDGTGEEADEAAAANDRIRVVHNRGNKGLGWNYKTGLEMAHMQYLVLVGGKHDIRADQLRRILAAHGRADVIIPYHTNANERPWYRRTVSRIYTWILNVMTGFSLHGYNESVLHETERARLFPIRTNSYAFQAELLIRMLKAGCSYEEVPIQNHYPRDRRGTKAFRLRNILGVAKFFCRTFYDARLARSR